MPTAFDAAARHAIYLERLKSRAVREVLELLSPLGDEVFAMVAGSDLEELTRREAQSLLASLNRTIRQGYEPVTTEIEGLLKSFGVYEGEWQADMLARTGLVANVGVASDADIWAAMYSRPFQGMLLRDWLKGLPDGTARRVRQAVRQGFEDGRSALDVARDIRGTRSRKGIWNMSARGAEAMVRTAYSHTAQVAQDRTYKANPSVKSVMHVSVLDSRTTAICQALSGRIWEIGSKEERRWRLPIHIGERSTRAPVTNRNRARLESATTYNEWLRAQSAATQDDILGPTKGRLYRKGDLTVDRFVNRAGEEYTLKQLRAKDAEAWEETYGDATVNEAIQKASK